MALTVHRWRRSGQDRLYLNEPGTRQSLGYYGANTGRLQLKPEHQHRAYEAVAALRPFLGSAVPESLRDRLPPTPPAQENDLARNRAGEAVAARAAELGPTGWQRVAGRVLGLRTEATSWEVGAKGERIVDKRLRRLEKDGWHVLASVVKRSGADIDHIVIGPPGVFTINTKHHRDARVWVGEHVLTVNGARKPYLPRSRHEAASASRILSSAAGTHVPVSPVIAVVGASDITQRGGHGDVLVARGEDIDRTLRRLPARCSPHEQSRVYDVARHAEIWRA